MYAREYLISGKDWSKKGTAFGRGKFDVEVSLEFVFNKKSIEFSIFGNILKWLKRRKKFSPKVFENVNGA